MPAKPDSDFVRCVKCERGYYGSEKDKCAAGWHIKNKRNAGGCFLGSRIKEVDGKEKDVS